MYNHGLVKFLQAKKLKSTECINLFLQEQGITQFTAKHHNRVNDYIQNNWRQFSTFCDQGIKSGKLKGNAVKLNTYYDEQKKRIEAIADEYRNAHLTFKHHLLISYIKKNGVDRIQSVLMKKGIQTLPKDLSFTAKGLQWLPLINQCIDNDIDIDLLNN